MPYLENLEELEIFRVTGLIEICKENRDYIYGYALYSKKIYTEYFKNY